MKPKTTLLVSIALTAFILVIIGSVVSSAAARGGDGSTLGSDPQIQQAVLEREAAYNQMLEEANSRIAELQAELDNRQDNGAGGAEVNVSPEEAVQIAGDVAASGATSLGDPELVSFEGTTAYEVPYEEGNIYVAADTGEVLFNGTVVQEPVRITAQDAAQIASNYMKNNKVSKVNMTMLNGELVFAVWFKNGDVVFVSDIGTLLLVRLESSGQGSKSGSSGGGGEHEGEREHEDDD
jgi:uncharacterized membrane protein YkoI